jgi:hypothetical protein
MASITTAEVDKAIADVRVEIQKLKSGALDEDLASVVLQPIPANFKTIISACVFPEPPNITTIMVSRAKEVPASSRRPKDAKPTLKVALLQIWKGINSHKYASPFRKPVLLSVWQYHAACTDPLCFR